MAEILQDLSAAALVQAIEANLFAMWKERARLPQVEMYEEPERMWFVSGVRLLGGNGVLWVNFTSEQADARIAEMLALFRLRRLPVTWWVGPSTRPADLGSRLRAHGLAQVADEPGMAADLLALNEDAPAPAGLVIQRVGDKGALRQWMRTFASGFGLPARMGRAIQSLEAGLGLGPELPRQLYLGLLGRKPVATALLFLGAGVAGLYGITTIPQARGQGIGTAMTLAALRQARAKGYRVGTLHASALGFPVYRRLGFREYCRMCQYMRA